MSEATGQGPDRMRELLTTHLVNDLFDGDPGGRVSVMISDFVESAVDSVMYQLQNGDFPLLSLFEGQQREITELQDQLDEIQAWINTYGESDDVEEDDE